MNWVGVTNPQVLPYVFWNGGIPAEVQEDVLRMNHIWARVRIDGAWYPLDPSFKVHTYNPGIDLATVLGYDRSGFLAAAESGSTIRADYVRYINETNINSHLTQYSNNLINYLRTNAPFAYLEDVIGGREIVPETLDGYPTQLPYTVESSWGETAEMPDDFMYKLHIEHLGIDYWANLPDIAGERVTIFYVGATPTDQATIDAAGGIYNVYPAYQVNMKPELRVGGELVGTGDSLSLGSWEPITVTIVTPIGDWAPRYAPQWLQAGEWYALPIMLQTVSPEALRRHHKALVESRAAGLADDSEPVLGQSLYNIGLSYFNQVDASDHVDAQIAGVVRVPYFRGMLMSQDLAVLEWDWIGGEWKPMRLGPASYTIDVRLNCYSILSASGNPDRERAFMTDSGHKGSATEHATIEQLQNNLSVSTIQVLDIANDEGLKIYHIISSTVDAILPLLDYPSRTKDSLREDVEAGYEVTVPEGNITYNQWTGTGWISFNPRSGSAGYWLSGSIGGAPGDYEVPPIRLGGSGTQTATVESEVVQEQVETALEGTQPQANDPDPDAPNNAGADPVDTATGAFVHSSLDLAFGVLGHPISFSRTYVSEGNRQEGPLGFGWTHTYNMGLVEGSDWARGFGFRTAMDAVAAIAEAYVGVDIAASPAGELPHQRIVIGSEASDWILAQMTGNVVTVTAADGQSREYLQLPDGTYYLSHELVSTLIPNGDGAYTEETKDGSQLNFDAEGRATSLVDANGNQTTLTYDAEGNLIRVTDAVGRSIELSYSDGYLTQITDPVNRTFRYEYDADGNLVHYTDARDGTTSYTCDSEHRITSITDPEGMTFIANVYDDFGRIVSQTDGGGGSMTLRYGDVHSTVIDPMGYPTVYFYDAYRRLVGNQDSLGYTTSIVYDANENVLLRTNWNGHTTTFGYDSRGNLISLTDPLSYTTWFTYDAQDNLTGVTDALGRTTLFDYDEQRNLTRGTDAFGYATTFSYDGRGQVIAMADANGHTITNSYDQHGNLTSVADGLGHATTMSYDVVGRLLTVTDPNSHTRQFSYDADDNLVTDTDALGNVTTYAYDGNSLLLSTIDARGNTTRFTYDPQFNLTSVADTLGHVTNHEYDANDNLTRIIDANAHATIYQRDALGRPTQVMDPLGRASSFVYDGNGNVVTSIKADGKVIEREYDTNDRLTRVSYPDDNSVSYEYDAAGNVTSTGYGTWQVQYEYDALDRPIRTDLPLDDVSIAYTYDAIGNPQSTVARRGMTLVYDVHYDYNAADRLINIVDGLSDQTITYTYDSADNLDAIVHCSGARTTYAYDAKDRVTRVENLDGNGGTMSSWAYTYDEVDNPLQVTRTAPVASLVMSYAYDAVDRLVCESYPRYSIEYAYDAAGNRIRMVSPLGTVDYTYDVADQLLSAGQTWFTYDANGNQTNRTDAHGTYTYTYDYEDRLVQIRGPGSITTTFSYDPSSRRVGTSGPTGESQFIYDGFSLILQQEGEPGRGTAYIYGNGLLAASRSLDPDNSSMVVAYHGDGLGTVVNLSDEVGTPRAAYGYDAFGQANAPAGDEDEPYCFLGRWGVRAEDAVRDLYLMGFRYYDATTGRFITTDPSPGILQYPPTLHHYAYALNNPLRYTDPMGLRPTTKGFWQTSVELLRGMGIIKPKHPPSKQRTFYVGQNLEPGTYPLPIPPGGIKIPPGADEEAYLRQFSW
jgi:RHS repeat-associated protein